MSELCDLTLRDAGDGLRLRNFSAVELLQSVFARMAVTEPEIHAYVLSDHAAAMAMATAADEGFARGEVASPVQGIPVGVKDIFDLAGWPTRCNSLVRENAPSAHADAETVSALRAGGAVFTGKTVTHEFAAGPISPPARNPWNPERITGGSSGGSGAAVAAGSAIAALGSDTGCSVRNPAALCGITGLKPTFGSLSTKGVYPLSWSLDTVGPLGRDTADVALMFQVMAGRSRFDAEGIIDGVKSDLRGVRIGVSRPHFFEHLQPDVESSTEVAIEAMRLLGAEIVDAPWHDAPIARAASFIINRVETASVHEQNYDSAAESFGADLRWRVAAFSLVPGVVYLRGQKARTLMRQSIANLYRQHRLDALVAPASPVVAAPADDLLIRYPDGSTETAAFAHTRLAMPFNLTGQPALAVPCGLDSQGLPVGIQIVGAPDDEAMICRIGLAFETTDIGRSIRPPMSFIQ